VTLLAVGSTCPRELDLADAERAPVPRVADPGEIEADELPERIETQTAGHDRVAGKMALKEPELGLDIQLGQDLALAVGAAEIGDAQ
jgi:hypothetical protein